MLTTNRKSGLYVVVVAYVWAIAISSLSLADDWPVVRGNASSTGVATGTLPAKPEVLWEYKTGSDKAGFEGTPVIAGGKVFIGDFDGGMHAIDLSNGKRVWYKKTKDGFVSAPAVSQGKVIIGDLNGLVYCFSAETGDQLWTREIDQPVASGPNLFGDNVLISSEGGTMHSLDLNTGEPKWTYQTGDQLRSSPTIWKTFSLLGGCDGRLHKIDIVEGKATGEGYSLDAPTLSTPSIIGNVAIVPTQPGEVKAIDVAADKILWTFADQDVANDIRLSPACLGTVEGTTVKGIAIIASRNRRVLALNMENGKLLWEQVLKKRADASPIICNGRVWVASENGLLYALDVHSGEEKWTYQLTGQVLASPVASDGKLILATEKGTVVCFGAK
ncbi:MAG: PQQ-binding-like beta-propeller repeat protein [Pirellula sp.]